jgi:hypothetical protein
MLLYTSLSKGIGGQVEYPPAIAIYAAKYKIIVLHI